MRKLARLNETVEQWGSLDANVHATIELMALAIESGDASLLDELAGDAQDLFAEAEEREFDLVLSGECDD